MSQDSDLVELIEGYGYDFSEAASELLYQLSIAKDFGLVYNRLIESYPEIAHPPVMSSRYSFQNMVDFVKTAQAREFLIMLGRLKAIKQIKVAEATDQLDKTITGNINPNHPVVAQSPFWDLASGTNPIVYFKNLSSNRQYVFVDIDPFVIAYLDQARKMLKVEDRVEVLEQDILNLKLKPNSIGTMRLKNVGTYIDTHAIPDDWYIRLGNGMAPGGQIIIEFRPNKKAGESNNPIILKLREILRVEEDGWGFKWGHFDGEDFIENEPGSEVPGLYFINTVIIFTKPSALPHGSYALTGAVSKRTVSQIEASI